MTLLAKIFDKLCKFCMDSGFLNVVEIGQYFMTKDSAEFSQFHAVACRWARIGSCNQHGMYGVGLQHHLHSILTHSLRTAFLRFPARCRLGPYCSSL